MTTRETTVYVVGLEDKASRPADALKKRIAELRKLARSTTGAMGHLDDSIGKVGRTADRVRGAGARLAGNLDMVGKAAGFARLGAMGMTSALSLAGGAAFAAGIAIQKVAEAAIASGRAAAEAGDEYRDFLTAETVTNAAKLGAGLDNMDRATAALTVNLVTATPLISDFIEMIAGGADLTGDAVDWLERMNDLIADQSDRLIPRWLQQAQGWSAELRENVIPVLAGITTGGSAFGIAGGRGLIGAARERGAEGTSAFSAQPMGPTPEDLKGVEAFRAMLEAAVTGPTPEDYIDVIEARQKEARQNEARAEREAEAARSKLQREAAAEAKRRERESERVRKAEAGYRERLLALQWEIEEHTITTDDLIEAENALLEALRLGFEAEQRRISAERVEGVAGGLNVLNSGATGILGALGPWGQVIAAIREIGGEDGRGFSDLATELTGSVDKVPDKIVNAIESSLDPEFLTSLLEHSISHLLEMGVFLIPRLAQAIGNAVAELWRELPDLLKQAFADILDDIRDFFRIGNPFKGDGKDGDGIRFKGTSLGAEATQGDVSELRASIPQLDTGGIITKSGLAFVDRGEVYSGVGRHRKSLAGPAFGQVNVFADDPVRLVEELRVLVGSAGIGLNLSPVVP